LFGITYIIIAGYKDLFNKTGDAALQRITQYPLEVVLLELVNINYALRSKSDLALNTSTSTQEALLEKWFGSRDSYLGDLYNRLNRFSNSVQKQVVIFNRAGSLFGIDYCYRHLKRKKEKFIYNREFWIHLIEFCLACNEVIIKYEKEKSAEEITELEHVTAQQALLSELNIISNPIFLFNRYISLTEYFNKDPFYEKEFSEFLSKSGLNPKSYITSLIEIYMNINQDKKLTFWIQIDGKKYPDGYALLEWMSAYKPIKKRHDLDLFTLYKWPVFKYSDSQFVTLDIELLLDKFYRQLLNDFYFDHLEGRGINYPLYRGFIGQFFEGHIASQFQSVFKKNYKIKLLHTDQLKFGNPKKELCDIYIRHKENVFIAQIKSSNFSDKQKFEGSYEFYKENLDRFYSDAGIIQLVRTIEWLNKYGSQHDSKIGSKTKIFPAVILNDKFFETPIMPQVLANEFHKRLGAIDNKFIVDKLLVLDVSSVERMKGGRMNHGGNFWKPFWVNNRSNGILPHFNNTLNRLNIKGSMKDESKKLIGYLNLKKR